MSEKENSVNTRQVDKFLDVDEIFQALKLTERIDKVGSKLPIHIDGDLREARFLEIELDEDNSRFIGEVSTEKNFDASIVMASDENSLRRGSFLRIDLNTLFFAQMLTETIDCELQSSVSESSKEEFLAIITGDILVSSRYILRPKES